MKQALLVIGMHRSGTSALTRVINLHGVSLGNELPDAAFDNEAGFWENQKVVRLHERVLEHLDSSWDDPRPLPEAWLETLEKAGYLDELLAVIDEEFGDAPVWAVKDPRLCRLLPLWLKALKRLDIQPKLVFALRHPVEVVGSLMRRNNLSPATASMMWMLHLAEPLSASGGHTRCVTDYAALLSDWRGCMRSIGSDLGVDWPVPSAEAEGPVEAHLRHDLRHQHAASAQVSLPGNWRESLLEIYGNGVAIAGGSGEWKTLEASIDAFLGRLAFAAPLLPELRVASHGHRLHVQLSRAVEAQNAYRAEAERLFHESAASKQEATTALQALATAEHEVALEKEELERSKQRLIEARGEIAKREARIVVLEQAKQELDLIKLSRSWRLTRPMRVLMRLVRSGGRFGEADRAQLRQLLGRPASEAGAQQPAASGSRNSPEPLPKLAAQVDGKRDVFVWSVIDWHFRIQRPQHLARELALAGHRVFYISCEFIDQREPAFSAEPLDEHGRLFRIQLGLTGNPAIYHAVPSLDARQQLRAGIGQVLAWAHSRSCLSLVEHPYWLEIARILPNSRLVYDCMDHHGGFADNTAEVLARESELMRKADLLVVTSAWLYDEAGKLNPRTVTIRNGCEYGHFATPADPCFRDDAGRKVLGYYGAIAEWFDLDLLEAVARRFDDCLVLMVGADTIGARERFRHLSNVRFVGEVPYAELPYYLSGFDVCLLPFQVIPLTLATNPVKVYEYLSAGKEVVAIDLPEMQQFSGLVRTAADHDAFVDAVGSALAAAPEEGALVAQRRQFAASQTWAHRAQDMVRAVAALPEPRVSVIVVTYNNLDLTKACLASLEAFSDYRNLEVIVVDNNSSDETPAYLEAWAAAGEDRRIVLNEDNRGFAAANNQGLALATGEYLVLLNNDTYVTPGWIATLIGHLDRAENIGMLGPVTNNIGNEARIDIAYDGMDEMLRVAADYTARHLGGLTPLRTAAFFCVMLRREVYEKVGPLDEAFGIGFFEDDDYCRRVEQAGWTIACADDVFVHHNLSASFNKLKHEKRQALFEQNRAIYEAKWGPWEPHRYRGE